MATHAQDSADDDSSASPPVGTPLDSLTYEQARDELIDVVAQLEAGGLALEDSLQLWERGEQLAATCQAWLDGARQRLDAVLHDAHPGDDADG